MIIKVIYCSNCRGILESSRLRCKSCDLAYEGTFCLPRLARLPPEHQRLAERIVLAAGNLKEVAQAMGVSYPTLRKRLDVVIASLRELRKADESRAQALLDDVEGGRLAPEAAARLIKEMSGGA
jgi:hypothetical protein